MLFCQPKTHHKGVLKVFKDYFLVGRDLFKTSSVEFGTSQVLPSNNKLFFPSDATSWFCSLRVTWYSVESFSLFLIKDIINFFRSLSGISCIFFSQAGKTLIFVLVRPRSSTSEVFFSGSLLAKFSGCLRIS